MGNYTIEQVDYLREKADVSYEEAVALLEQYQGDLTRCLIDLERKGRIRKGPAGAKRKDSQFSPEPGTYSTQGNYQYGGREYRKPFVLDWQTVKGYLFSRVVVTKRDLVIANLSVIFLLIVLFSAPWLFFFSVLAMFLLGYRVKWQRQAGAKDTPQDKEVYEFVDKAARNIKRTASSFANAVKQEVYGGESDPAQDVDANAEQAGEPAQPAAEEDDNDPSDMTIE